MNPEPMLAAKYDPERTLLHLQEDGFLYIQPKIDGMRVLFDNGIARSRSWKAWTNRYLQAFARDHSELIHGWDGEMVPGHSYNPEIFREAMSGLRSEDGSKDFTIYLFDNWDQSWAHFTYESRASAITSDLMDEIRIFQGDEYCVHVKLCPTWKVYSLDDIDRMETELLLAGWEGAILRRKGRGYKWGRSTAKEGSLTKLKRFEDAEATIIGVEVAYQNNNEAQQSAFGRIVRSAHQENLTEKDYVGALIVQFYKEFDGHSIAAPCREIALEPTQFNIGVFKGPTIEDRKVWFQNKDSLIGRIVKFTHQGYGGGYDKPRTPVFIGFRDPLDIS